MAKHNRKGRSKGGGQFLKLPYYLINSKAFCALNGSSIRLLIQLASRFTVRSGGYNNNGELFVSYADAKKQLGMGTDTVKRAYADLTEKGFVKKTQNGNFYLKEANTYAVTFLPLGKQSTQPSNEWKRWQK